MNALVPARSRPREPTPSFARIRYVAPRVPVTRNTSPAQTVAAPDLDRFAYPRGSRRWAAEHVIEVEGWRHVLRHRCTRRRLNRRVMIGCCRRLLGRLRRIERRWWRSPAIRVYHRALVKQQHEEEDEDRD